MKCKKKQYDSKEDAENAIKYLIKNGFIENANYNVYECPKCFKYHFGRSSGDFNSYGTVGLKRK